MKLTPRQFQVLDVFVRFLMRKNLPRRPTLQEIAQRLNAKSRAGIYCGHIVPLLEKGFLDRDLPDYERRGYFITPRGRRAYNARKREYAQDAKQSAVEG